MKQILLDPKHPMALLKLFGGSEASHCRSRELLPGELDLSGTWIDSLSTFVTLFRVLVFPINLLFYGM